MKKIELILNILAIPVDILTLLLAATSSFYLRLSFVNLVGPIIYTLHLSDFLKIVGLIIPSLLVFFGLLGLYNIKGSRKIFKELGKIIIGVSLGLLLVIILFFFNRSIFPSRFIILATWALGIVFVFFGRFVLKIIQEILLLKGLGLHKLVVISSGNNLSKNVIENIFKNKKTGYEITAELIYGPMVFEVMDKLFLEKRMDEILQADSSLSDDINSQLVLYARNKGLQFSFVPNLFEVQRNSVETYKLNGVPVISLKNTPLDGWGKVAKRVFDVLASIICLLLTAPLFILVALAIKLDSKGRIIYAAMRGGSGKDFEFYKFRTMYSHLSVGESYGGAEAEKVRRQLWKVNDRGGKDAPFLKIKHDPRVTRVGRFLRKSKLDEIPQFYNVLRGDMSMVGPRAHVIEEVERYRSRYRRMFSIKPGIFGMSQIAQFSWPDLPFEEEIKLNTYYIENWSLWLDIKILSRILWLLLFGSKPKEDY